MADCGDGEREGEEDGGSLVGSVDKEASRD
jgi:hypothetical protein